MPTSNQSQIRTMPPAKMPAAPVRDRASHSSLQETERFVQQVRASAERELALARKLRTDAQKYHRDTTNRARSEAQQLILQARLNTQRQVEELIRKASEEIQKVLADIRVIRITAQEELAAQRKFTDAARLCSMTLDLREPQENTVVKPKKKQLAVSK